MRLAGTLLAVLVIGSASAGAQTGSVFNRTGSGARAAGMANAFIAVSDDGTAASWNPAGLGQLRMPEFSVVTTTSRRSLASEGFRTRDDLAVFSPFRSAYGSAYLDFASLAVPATILGKPVTFQASWRRLYTLDFRANGSVSRERLTPQGPPPVLIQANDDAAGGIDLLSIAGAVKLTSRLALGGSFNSWRGNWTEDAATSETPLEGPGPPRFVMTSQASRLRGESLSLGLMLTYPRWNIGVQYQGRLHGDFAAGTTTRTSRDPQPPPLSFEGRLRFPQAVGVGAAWRPATRWTVAFDLTWDQWTDSLFFPADGPPVNLFDELPPDRSPTRDTWSANAGAEHEGVCYSGGETAGWDCP